MPFLDPGCLIPIDTLTNEIPLSKVDSECIQDHTTVRISIHLDFENAQVFDSVTEFTEAELEESLYLRFDGHTNIISAIDQIVALNSSSSVRMINMNITNAGGKAGTGSGFMFMADSGTSGE